MHKKAVFFDRLCQANSYFFTKNAKTLRWSDCLFQQKFCNSVGLSRTHYFVYFNKILGGAYMKKKLMILAIFLVFAAGIAHATGKESTEYSSNASSSQKDSASTLLAPETDKHSTTESSTVKKWGVKFGFITPIPQNLNFNPNENSGLNIIAKRFIQTGIRNLTIPIEIEASFFRIFSKYEHEAVRSGTPIITKISSKYDDSFFDLSNNVLARFNPLSWFFVEGGIKWGYNITPISNFIFGTPVGFGVITDIFEIGARVTFDLTDRDSNVGRVTHIQFISFSLIF